MSQFEPALRTYIAQAADVTHEQVKTWRTTAWMNLISIASGIGILDNGYKFSCSNADRANAATALRRALGFLYGMVSPATRLRAKVAGREPNAIEYFAAQRVVLPPRPAGGEDAERFLSRHVVLAALTITAYDLEPAHVFTLEELQGITRAVGLAA